MTFILHDSSYGRHVNCRVTQKTRNSSLLYYETKDPFEVKILQKVTLWKKKIRRIDKKKSFLESS